VTVSGKTIVWDARQIGSIVIVVVVVVVVVVIIIAVVQMSTARWPWLGFIVEIR
jgi:hypothetical protein